MLTSSIHVLRTWRQPWRAKKQNVSFYEAETGAAHTMNGLHNTSPPGPMCKPARVRWFLYLGSCILGLISWILQAGLRPLVLGSCFLGLGFWVLDSWYCILDLGSCTVGLGSCVLLLARVGLRFVRAYLGAVGGAILLVSASWFLYLGYWISVFWAKKRVSKKMRKMGLWFRENCVL